jgi:hypothetical protein
MTIPLLFSASETKKNLHLGEEISMRAATHDSSQGKSLKSSVTWYRLDLQIDGLFTLINHRVDTLLLLVSVNCQQIGCPWWMFREYGILTPPSPIGASICMLIMETWIQALLLHFPASRLTTAGWFGLRTTYRSYPWSARCEFISEQRVSICQWCRHVLG